MSSTQHLSEKKQMHTAELLTNQVGEWQWMVFSKPTFHHISSCSGISNNRMSDAIIQAVILLLFEE